MITRFYLIFILMTVTLSNSCVQSDCDKIDPTTLSGSALANYEAQCGGQEEEVIDEDPANETEAVGYYSNNGELVNGENIMSRNTSLIHKIFTGRDRYYGTNEIIDVIVDIAQEMDARFSDIEKLQIGDIANKEGGSAAPNHASHQNGLDVDIVYYSKSRKLQGTNNGYWTQYFVQGGKLVDFDTFRNWEMFKYIVENYDVGRIFVDPVIKEEICRYTKAEGEFSANIEVLRRLRPLEKHHGTHFHLRLKCPVDDTRCIDQTEPPQGSGC